MAATNTDIALSGNDLLTLNGDFAIQDSDAQHIADTLNAFPGWWKENPPDGVGVFQYLNSGGQEQSLRRSIQINLKADAYRSNPIVKTNSAGLLSIDPNIR